MRVELVLNLTWRSNYILLHQTIDSAGYVLQTTAAYMKKEVQGRWGRVATRCAAIAERDEDSRRPEDDIIRYVLVNVLPFPSRNQHIINHNSCKLFTSATLPSTGASLPLNKPHATSMIF